MLLRIHSAIPAECANTILPLKYYNFEGVLLLTQCKSLPANLQSQQRCANTILPHEEEGIQEIITLLTQFILVNEFVLYLPLNHPLHTATCYCERIIDLPSNQQVGILRNHLIGASLSKPHTSESPPQILVLSTVHKKLRQKSDNLRVRREFNGVDYSAFLYGSCNRPCHNK